MFIKVSEDAEIADILDNIRIQKDLNKLEWWS